MEDFRGIWLLMEKHCPVFFISRVSRQGQSYGLQNMQHFSVFSDAEIDEIVVEYLSRHGLTKGKNVFRMLLAVTRITSTKKKGSQKFH